MLPRSSIKMALKHVCVFVTLLVAECAALSGKGLYCRDPDSGKFHAVNTTWSSSTFCGNYTCKLRKRNITETEYTPLRQINISAVHNETDEKFIIDQTTNSEMNYSLEDNTTVTVEERLEPEIEPIIHKNKTEADLMDDTNTKNLETDTNTDNRYLTEKEIKSIADILHTVKKSDLDAIVDIYSLAQDIYNEMDKATNEGIIDDTINTIANDKFKEYTKKSYWYDPMAYKEKDMEYQGSNSVPSTIQPKRVVPTYFNGALTNQDFGKLPYYYPLSPFQRSSSYLHQPTNPTMPVKPRPCKYKTHSKPIEKNGQNMKVEAQNVIKPSYLLPYPFAYIHHYNYSYPSNIYFNNPYAWDYYNSQRNYQPYYNAYITQTPNAGPNAVLMNPNLHDQVSNIELKSVEDKDLLGKLLYKTKENLIPDWKTEQLSNKILDEVRSNIDTSKLLKAFPFRKKVRLEKVGKLINVDDLTRARRSAYINVMSRGKRSVDIEDELTKSKELTDFENKVTEVFSSADFKDKLKKGLRADFKDMFSKVERSADVEEVTEDGVGNVEGEYEAYLEKTTCQTQAVPGYFRYGNLTQPYPECCPQMINKK